MIFYLITITLRVTATAHSQMAGRLWPIQRRDWDRLQAWHGRNGRSRPI